MAQKRIDQVDGGEWIHRVSLPNDHGKEIRVEGTLKAEDMHFNNQNGMLTVEKIYDLGEGRRAYSVISAIGHTRHRSAYLVEEKDAEVLISNGSVSMQVPTDDLLYLLALTLEDDASRQADEAELGHMRRRLAVND
jgi:hypothetical protein